MATLEKYTNAWRLTTDHESTAGGRNIPDNFGGKQSPKFKFNFTAKFVLNRDLQLPFVSTGSEKMEEMVFALKQATRPKPIIQYQDINFYNFRTKVATYMDYGTATLTFYDDNVNNSHNILAEYLKMISPIANAKAANSTSFDRNGQGTAASIGALNQRHGPITSINVYHHYFKNNTQQKMKYEYLNPRIVNFDWDDLDMAVSEVSNLTITFNYDSVNIEEE